MDIKKIPAVIFVTLLNITVCYAVEGKSITYLCEPEPNLILREVESPQEHPSQPSDFIDIGTFKEMSLTEIKKTLSTWPHHYPIHENYAIILLNKLTSAPVICFNLPKYLPAHIVTENGILSTVKWCKLRALEKDPESQYNLGTMYHNGYKIKQNYRLAFKYYLKSAKGGHAKARHQVAIMYEKGQNVTKDYAKAIKWYLAAARRGHEKAKDRIKQYIKASGNFASALVLPSALASELQQIKDQINSIQDRYIEYSAVSGGGFADNFGEMSFLRNQCETILTLIDHYKKVIPLLTSSIAFINCITLKEYYYYPYFICFLQDSDGPYVCLENKNHLQEINKNLLPGLLNNLYQMVRETRQTLDESQGNIIILKGVLLGIRRFNTEAYDFLEPLLSRYLNAATEKDKANEYAKITGFLEQLEEHLSKDIQLAQNLTKRMNQLIIETAPYRNYLFQYHYPWLFQ